MDHSRTQTAWWRGGAGALAFWLAAAGAWGGLAVPLYVGNLVPALDQYGQPLPGTYDAPPSTCSRVEVRTAANGIVPPSANGAANITYNPLLNDDSIGWIGMNTTAPGLFCIIYPLRPAKGVRVFARAFNAPTTAEASFYTDTLPAIVTETAISMVLTFGPTKPLDTNDFDGDGLINSWEKALGTSDRATPDYDDDGTSDYHEMLAGTDPTDPKSHLVFNSIQRVPDTAPADADAPLTLSLRIKWQSVPGKRYELQYTPRLVGEQEIILVGEAVTAGADEYEVERLVVIPGAEAVGSFRLKLLLEE